MIGNDCSGVR